MTDLPDDLNDLILHLSETLEDISKRLLKVGVDEDDLDNLYSYLTAIDNSVEDIIETVREY